MKLLQETSSQTCRSFPLFSFQVLSDRGAMTWRREDFSVDSDSSMAHQRSVMHRVLPLNFREKHLRQFVQQNGTGEMCLSSGLEFKPQRFWPKR